MKNLKDLAGQVVKFRDARDWKQFHNPKDLSLSLVLEATEVMEHFQWKNIEEMKKHMLEYKEDIGKELADVLYWVLLMSADLNINLEKAFNAKMKENNLKYPVKKAKGKHTKYTNL